MTTKLESRCTIGNSFQPDNQSNAVLSAAASYDSGPLNEWSTAAGYHVHFCDKSIFSIFKNSQKKRVARGNIIIINATRLKYFRETETLTLTDGGAPAKGVEQGIAFRSD